MPLRLLPILLALFLSACSAPEPGSVKEHMQSSQKLHTLIHDLDNIVFDRVYSELERDELRIRYARELAREIDTIVEALKTDPHFIQEFASRNQEGDYQTIVDLLQSNNHALKTLVDDYQPEKIEPFVQNSKNLCSACHRIMRDPQ